MATDRTRHISTSARILLRMRLRLRSLYEDTQLPRGSSSSSSSSSSFIDMLLDLEFLAHRCQSFLEVDALLPVAVSTRSLAKPTQDRESNCYTRASFESFLWVARVVRVVLLSVCASVRPSCSTLNTSQCGRCQPHTRSKSSEAVCIRLVVRLSVRGSSSSSVTLFQ